MLSDPQRTAPIQLVMFWSTVTSTKLPPWSIATESTAMAPTSNDRDQHSSLPRALGLLDATMIVVGSMIGSGIFIVSAESLRLVGSPGWLVLAWAIAGLMTISGALCCAELAAMMPQAGGQYVFLREAYGPATAFLFGWSLLLVIQTGTIAAVAIAFANFMGVLTERVSATTYIIAPVVFGQYAVSLSTQQLVAIGMIVVLTFSNTRGLRLGTLIQNTFTVAKTAALGTLILVGLIAGWNSGSAAYTSSWWNPWANGWDSKAIQPDLEVTGVLALTMILGRAMIGPLFAQSAWNNVTFTGGEIRNPGRNLPRALLIGCVGVVALYLLANVAYVVTLPLVAIQQAEQNRVATAVMRTIVGAAGTVVMAIAIMISTFGANNGLILAGARVSYAMARDGLLFSRIGTLNANRVPAVALIMQGVWAAVLTLPRTVGVKSDTGAIVYGNVYTQLLEYIVPADLVLFALMVGAVIVMRRKAPGAERPYRTWGYPIVPAIYLTLAVLLILDLAYLAPSTSGIGFLILFTGLPVYLAWRRAVGAAALGRRGFGG
jgi:APA family basic amino acid/polyamine antiporter